MDEMEVLVVLELEPGTSAEEVVRLGQQLRVELLDSDVEAMRRVPAQETSADAKAKGPAVDWGQWLLTLSASGGVFTSVIMVAKDWLGRNTKVQRLKMTIDDDTIELERATTAERDLLIRDWLKRHDRGKDRS
jgi:hypothetical protein